MDVRSQLAMVFHLDKCLGCHTCSVACKNVWTNRPGAEYMWWNNVETKPGTGYPTRWEDQEQYRGGWERNGSDAPRLRSTSRLRMVTSIFHHPHMPTLDDYYEPWTYDYGTLFNAPEGNIQPTARAMSLVTGKPMEPQAGPNWDDDLGGSAVYAAQDPNLDSLTPFERQQLFAVERLIWFYLPRTCNHCLNPACVAACPSGALHKRGEDGIVLVDQDRCRGWRACVPACPYKKTFYNWQSGKSEKCILCFPRIEAGEAPACFHSCVGRIRYLGVLLYDASRIATVASAPDDELVEAQRSMILDPSDSDVVRRALANGVPPSVIASAQRSPVYRFVKEWKLALPAHVEFRTLPMLFYVPPLSPVIARRSGAGALENMAQQPFADGELARLPMKYLAALFGAGNAAPVSYALRKEQAVRAYRRAATVGDVTPDQAAAMLRAADSSVEEAEAIYRLTSLCTVEDRFVIPPSYREQAMEMEKEARP
jgi:nitrate reductase beta subunit